MSKTEQDENLVNQQVVISADDCNAALDFWRHFNIPISSGLQEAMDSFAKEPTFENQQKIKLEITSAIINSEHDAFKDDMFQKIVAECSGVNFDMQFDKDFEETVKIEE